MTNRKLFVASSQFKGLGFGYNIFLVFVLLDV